MNARKRDATENASFLASCHSAATNDFTRFLRVWIVQEGEEAALPIATVT